MLFNQFKLLKIFQKELIYKTHDEFEVNENLNAGINIELDAMNLDKNIFLSSLRINFSATSNDKAVFDIFLNLCGVFTYIDQSIALNDDFVKDAVQVIFPTILFPYARQIVAQTTYNGGFPNIVLDNIDFDDLRKSQDKQASMPSTTSTTQ